MNILLVITGLEVGGAERQVIDIADELISHGHKVTIAYFLGTARLRPKKNEVKLVELGSGKKNIWAFLFGFLSLISLIKALKPDVVHAHMFHAIIISRLIRIFIRIPRLICTSHSSYDGGRLRMLCYRITSYFGDEFTNVSQKAVDQLEDRGAAKKGSMLAILNGININNFSYSSEKRYFIRQDFFESTQILLSVGRFHKAKDYPNLLQAFFLICKVRSDVELWIAGDGPLKKEMVALIKSLGLERKVKLLGIRDDIPYLMNAADIYVLSSAWEGFGLVVAEAMATERVVVATDCGGVREVVGDCGFLVPASDSILLSDALNDALRLNNKSRVKLGKSARLRIKEHYSINVTVQKWLDIYIGRPN
ncbi:glycosyltransferase [Vibrio rumoiensis]|uniref:Glycosyl transferase n=1 Tax=Vibrio rumoiensis 1S-45 TaxID=1188252 RepID=A0A1E5E2Y8_9VIBR|nr:glycosyltransferase [Vibrio rumoiensis]OEF25933.1 hypothetical protein A1QC_07625 [Vibrio rumoiensis 1S-45]